MSATLKQNSLLEKLSLQVQSFQQSFEILSNSYHKKGMMKNYSRILKEVFLTEDAVLFYKTSADSDWVNEGWHNKTDKSDLSFLTHNDFHIDYYENNKYSISVVLPLNDSSLLGILIGKRSDGENYTAVDKITLQILLQVFSSAYKSFLDQKKEKELIFDLNEKIFQLNNLIDTGIELSRFGQKDILFEYALERVSSLTNASSALIKISSQNGNNGDQLLTFPRGLNPSDILESEYKLESSFEYLGKSYQIFLSEKETRGGVTSFNDLDKLLLDAIARQISASIENDFLHQQSLEKKLIEKELNVAALIQQQIIPAELPKINGYDIYGINIPSKEVGGDYYDCIKLKSGKVAIIIADVSGKGISAALLVNTLNAALYSYLEFNLPVTEISDKLNKLIYKSSPSDKFITFFIAILNPETGDLDVVNAGHNPILLLRKDGSLEKLNAGGVGLGMFDFGIPYEGQKLNLSRGDKIFFYTDGIPEAMNEKEEEYSDEKMIEFLTNYSDKSPEIFIKSLVDDVKNYTGDTPQSDDITALMLTRI